MLPAAIRGIFARLSLTVLIFIFQLQTSATTFHPSFIHSTWHLRKKALKNFLGPPF